MATQTQLVGIRVPADLLAKIDQVAYAEDRSRHKVMLRALREKFTPENLDGLMKKTKKSAEIKERDS